MAKPKPADEPPDLSMRPRNQLLLYPVRYRWEFTRRHPYYQVFWHVARRYYTNPPDETPEGRVSALQAMTLLGSIGVAWEPVDPKMEIDQLLDGVDPGILNGALQPVTVRHLLIMLVRHLSPATLGDLGKMLVDLTKGHVDGTAGPQAYDTAARGLLDELSTSKIPDLGKYPDAPIFWLNLDASQNAIAEDAKDQVRRWKHEKGVGPSPKIHMKAVAKQLAVWDRREGWAEGAYALSREMPFRKIAEELKVPLSTVQERYAAAFELVTGVAYTPERWWMMLGPLKVDKALKAEAGKRPAGPRRWTRSKVPRDVPEGVVDPARRRLIDGVPVIAGDQAMSDLKHDIRSLIRKRFTTEEVCEQLELVTDDAVRLVEHFRDHEMPDH